jgi:predicted metal-dependent hydrolase
VAMAKQQLNRADEARASLAEAAEIIQKEMPQLEGSALAGGWGEYTGGWREWLMAYALMHEATALIQGPPPPPKEE